MGNVVELGQLTLIRLRHALSLVGSKTVVELVEHLGLVQRQHERSVFLEPIGIRAPPGRYQFSPRTKQTGVVGHMEHSPKTQTPGIPVRMALPPEHTCTAICQKVDVGVAL